MTKTNAASRSIAKLTLCGALLAGGCAHSYQRDWVAEGYRTARAGLVAVLPFENLTPHPNAGEIVRQALSTELYARRFSLLEDHEVRRALKVDGDDEGRKLTTAEMRALGRQLGADSVLAGSVGEFRYKRDLGEDPVVGFSVRLIDVGTGDVVWAATHSRAEYGILYHKHNLHENVQRVAELMVDHLVEAGGGEPPQRAAAARPVPARTVPAAAAPAEPASRPPSRTGSE